MNFYNPLAETKITENRLPHWQQEGSVYFVTWRLADSIPQHLLERWHQEREIWLKIHPEPWSKDDAKEYHERFSQSIDAWLDAGHGSCSLRDPGCRNIISSSFDHFNEQRCKMLSYVIMPNHVHLCFVLHEEWSLQSLINTWKRWTSTKINKQLGKTGVFWMPDYFDRLIRDAGHLHRVFRYIRNNPLKGKLQKEHFTLWESEFVGKE